MGHFAEALPSQSLNNYTRWIGECITVVHLRSTLTPRRLVTPAKNVEFENMVTFRVFPFNGNTTNEDILLAHESMLRVYFRVPNLVLIGECGGYKSSPNFKIWSKSRFFVPQER